MTTDMTTSYSDFSHDVWSWKMILSLCTPGWHLPMKQRTQTGLAKMEVCKQEKRQ